MSLSLLNRTSEFINQDFTCRPAGISFQVLNRLASAAAFPHPGITLRMLSLSDLLGLLNLEFLLAHVQRFCEFLDFLDSFPPTYAR